MGNFIPKLRKPRLSVNRLFQMNFGTIGELR